MAEVDALRKLDPFCAAAGPPTPSSIKLNSATAPTMPKRDTECMLAIIRLPVSGEHRRQVGR
jgi:hypothetical protein